MPLRHGICCACSQEGTSKKTNEMTNKEWGQDKSTQSDWRIEPCTSWEAGSEVMELQTVSWLPVIETPSCVGPTSPAETLAGNSHWVERPLSRAHSPGWWICVQRRAGGRSAPPPLTSQGRLCWFVVAGVAIKEYTTLARWLTPTQLRNLLPLSPTGGLGFTCLSCSLLHVSTVTCYLSLL